MKKFTIDYVETIVRTVEVSAPNSEAVRKRFEEGMFPFTLGKEIAADMRIASIQELDEVLQYNFSEGDPL